MGLYFDSSVGRVSSAPFLTDLVAFLLVYQSISGVILVSGPVEYEGVMYSRSTRQIIYALNRSFGI